MRKKINYWDMENNSQTKNIEESDGNLAFNYDDMMLGKKQKLSLTQYQNENILKKVLFEQVDLKHLKEIELLDVVFNESQQKLFLEHAMSTHYDQFRAERMDLTKEIMSSLKERKYKLRSLVLRNCKSIHDLPGYLQSTS